jgi:RNA polymerase sporulation-specific sigma factor|nr:MAG TPA: DNA directed RNA polymerase subunit [Caudoviricetes sp.]
MNNLLTEYSKTKSKEIRDKIILHNTKLVYKIVDKYTENDKDDLLQIGMIGLIKAVDSYSLDKKIAWSTYMYSCVSNEIRMYFRIRNYEKRSKYVECSIYTEVDVKKDNPVTIVDMIYDKNINIFEEVALNIEIEKINKTMKKLLSEREYRTMELRYGLNGNSEHTQQETADIMGIHRTQISRYEKKAMQKIKNELIEG